MFTTINIKLAQQAAKDRQSEALPFERRRQREHELQRERVRASLLLRPDLEGD